MHPIFAFTTPIELKMLNPSWIEPAALVEIAQVGEAAGFDEISAFDHCLEPPAWQPGHVTSAYDIVPLLAFLAARTTRIRLGTSTIDVPYRHPVVMANELATLDRLSGGRLVVGLGTGYLAEEYRSLGLDWQSRGRVTDDYLQAMLALWSDEAATYEGEFVSFHDVTLAARPVQLPQPELWAYGSGIRALQRAIRWCTGWAPFITEDVPLKTRASDSYAEAIQQLAAEHPEANFAQPLTFAGAAQRIERFRDEIAAREQPLGLMLGMGIEVTADSIEEAPRLIDWHLEHGATKVGVRVRAQSLDAYLDILRRFGETVIPLYRSADEAGADEAGPLCYP